MRAAYISHSLVADRQRLFAEELQRQLVLEGGGLFQLFPGAWGQHVRRGGWFVSHPGDMMHFQFPKEAWDQLVKWDPDIVLVQNEAYCRVTKDAAAWCVANRKPYVTFSWENGFPPDAEAAAVLQGAAVRLYGNTEAKAQAESVGVDGRYVFIPQVGIDPGLFSHDPNAEKQFDILFSGRRDPMKGESVLDEATRGMGWKVRKLNKEWTPKYELLPAKFRSAKIQCTPSIDLPNLPREQFSPACSVEGLMTGLPVVTTKQSAIYEWMKDCPAATFAEPGDIEDLRECLKTVLDGPGKFLGVKGRDWAIERFSNMHVAKLYTGLLKEALA